MTRSRLAIVDDDHRYLRSVRRVLWTLAQHLEVSAYHSGEEALHALEANPADMVVMDVRMPGLDGIEACRQLKASGAPYVVLVSGHMSTETRERALEAGADLALPKPYDLADALGARFELTCVRPTSAELISSDHVAMAQNIARAMARKYSSLLPACDIEGLALLGLCEAARRYVPERNGLFIAFAASRVRGAVLDEIRRLASARAAGDASAGLVQLDELPSPVPSADSEIAASQLRAALKAARDVLEGPAAEVIYRHYDLGESLASIADRLQLSKSRVQQLHTRSIEKLRSHTSERGGPAVARTHALHRTR